MSIWTPEKVAELKSYIDRKFSGGRTAQSMGLRTNQVVGKAHRLGLSFHSVAGHAYRKPSGGDRGWRPTPKPTPVIEQPTTPHEYLMIPLRELPENGCRFIPGDDRLYCGQVQDGDSSYCRHCRGLMYRIIPRAGPMNLKAWS